MQALELADMGAKGESYATIVLRLRRLVGEGGNVLYFDVVHKPDC